MDAQPIPGAAPDAHFNGPEFDPERDHERLSGQIQRVYKLMRDRQWRTLDGIATQTGDPHASISAQLRHLRKARFGGHTVNRRHITRGLFEYQLVPAAQNDASFDPATSRHVTPRHNAVTGGCD